MSEPFIAEIRVSAYNFAPRGWAYCDGQLLAISQHTALFSILGTTFGGDGRTTVGLPDLRDRIPMHPGSGPGLTNRRLGERGGVDTVTLSAQDMVSHTHMARAVNAQANTNSAGASSSPAQAQGRGVNLYSDAIPDVALLSLGETGGGGGHANIQPTLVTEYIIALEGLYPIRS